MAARSRAALPSATAARALLLLQYLLVSTQARHQRVRSKRVAFSVRKLSWHERAKQPRLIADLSRVIQGVIDSALNLGACYDKTVRFRDATSRNRGFPCHPTSRANTSHTTFPSGHSNDSGNFSISDIALDSVSSVSDSSFFSLGADSANSSREMPDDERLAYAERRIIEENTLLKQVEDAKVKLERVEAEWLAAPDGEKKPIKAQRWKAKRQLSECTRRLERFQSSVQIGELSTKVSIFEDDVTDVKARQAKVEDRQTTLEKQVAEERTARKNLEEKVDQLAKQQGILRQEHGDLRLTVDQIDNRVRLQSIVFHGVDTTNSYAFLAQFLPAAALDAIDVITEIGLPNDLGLRTSILVRFVTVRDCQRVEDFLRSDEFRGSAFAGTSWHHDSSELQRVGRTRMIAAGDALQQAYPGIELRATFVRFPPESGMKHFAQEFANSHIIINDVPFNIDSAVAANPEYISNPAAKVTLGGRTYNGVRLKNRGGGRSNRGRGRGRGGGPSVQPTHVQPQQRDDTGSISNRNAYVSTQASIAPAPPRSSVQHRSPTRSERLTNHLPPMDGPSSNNVQLFANGGNYGSTRPSNKMGSNPDRYAAHSSRFSPYDVR